jgi:4-diphosphocytidyl-2C-methyl-D-erythritol kinase
LPELQELKRRLQQDSGGAFDAVFMTGSGSTMVGVGSHQVCSTRSGNDCCMVVCGQHLEVSPYKAALSS